MKYKKIKDMLRKASYRDRAKKRVEFWAWALDIGENEIYDLPSVQEAQGSVEAVDIAIKKKFSELLQRPKTMARILGAKEKNNYINILSLIYEFYYNFSFRISS